jgi:hypothetical protein
MINVIQTAVGQPGLGGQGGLRPDGVRAGNGATGVSLEQFVSQ